MKKLTDEQKLALRDSIYAETARIICTEERLNKVIKELDLIGFSDLTDYLSLGKNGTVTWKDPEKLRKKGLTRAIKRIRRRRTYKPGKKGEDETVITDEVDFELHSKQDALNELVNMMGVRPPQKHDVKHSGAIEYSHSPEERERIRKLSKLLSRHLREEGGK